MKKLVLTLSLLIGFLAIVVWKAWPKDMPLPETEKGNLLEIHDYGKLAGRPISSTPLKNGSRYKYSESLLNDCALRALMQNGVLNEKTFNFRSMYQVCKSSEAIKTLFNEQKLMAKVPGMHGQSLLVDTARGTIDLYSGNETVYITAFVSNIYYSIQIEPGFEIEKDSLVKMVSERLERIKTRKI